MKSQRKFWELPLEKLDRAEWEALCDGCGKCCLHKVEDDDTGDIYHTNIACKLLDLESARCSDYRHRKIFVPDCLRLSRSRIREYSWLPPTCSYVLRADDQPLPEWHYLISGDTQSIYNAGQSVRGRVISENDAGPIERHILKEPL
ncbi:hypothetical protein LPB140_00645 [Sphingorhabdus lutea]|uniref:Uncharacterized protein n=1 Tax=Sphingorhabdus lutea TaxID=1913578 RepID=A0A1L3J8Z4_9SPHN|nr:YcgN family cysteine cluster protein [Sphingorhabdus lutea]APG61597.1 hypothetical protein LPB140_00645 [Sphingorhabdus lutea]